MTSVSARNKRRLRIAGLVVMLLIAGYLIQLRYRLEEYQVIRSPDQRFRVVVYRRRIWPSTMPGQGSDAPGVVRLYDRSGKLLDEAEISMVQHMNDIVWTRDRVEVPLIFSWPLPP